MNKPPKISNKLKEKIFLFSERRLKSKTNNKQINKQ